ncbi:hypothetical protein LSM04_002629 [Trypanosoma melophagium]|uniref:uncharacterized protein n=1 Tax=Trypanosoma melophagium TaxID=715481 RepID=UPI00351A0B79|nr:hypothetical protein LSM04_002629 [Trypanosoma melophagium]
MYRTKKSDGRTSTVTEAQVNDMDTLPPQEAPMTEPTLEPTLASSVMYFKARLLAPFMLFDKNIRQVVPNPTHDRLLRAEVSRVQGVILRELRRTLENEPKLTPKETLYAIQKSVMLAFASCIVSSDLETLVPITSDEEAVDPMARLENIFAERNACAKAVASLGAVLSTGIVRDTFGEACKRLEARLASEEHSNINSKRTKNSKFALGATKKNTQDLVQLRNALITAFDAISTPFYENGTKPLANSSTSDASAADLTVESYYSLLGWVLMLQPERLHLEAIHSTVSPIQKPREAVEQFAKVTSYNPSTGEVTIVRAKPTSKWGLMINAGGTLIGLENSLRNATSSGGELYSAIQQQKDGLAIFNINGRSIRSSKSEKEDTPEAKASRMGKILEVLRQSDLEISLTLTKVEKHGEPREVAFDLIDQGGEGTSGQQAALILRRPCTEVQWQLTLRLCSEGFFVLDDFSSSLQLSKEAEKFLSTHRGHLLITHVNGCAITNNKFLMDLISSSVYLVLRLRVVDDVERLMGEMTPEGATGANTISTMIGENVGPAVEYAAQDALPQTDVPGELEDAEVAQHRALLEEHHIDPDEPLPHAVEEEGVVASKKKGRPKKVTASEENVNELGEEATPIEMEEYNAELPAEKEVEELSAKRKKGRPKKVTASEKNVNELGEEATPIEMEEYNAELPAEKEVEELSAKRKKGRPKKVTASEENVNELGEEATPIEMEEYNAELPAEKEVEELSAKRKKGRPKKVTASEENVNELGEEATPIEMEEYNAELPAENEVEEEMSPSLSKKGKGKADSNTAQVEGKKKKSKEKNNREGVDELDAVAGEDVVRLNSVEKNPQTQGEVDTQQLAMAEEVNTKKNSKKTTFTSAEIEGSLTDNTSTVGVADVPRAVLERAPPLMFENAVTLDRFDGTHMELRRPDLKTPWNMKVTIGGDKLVLTRLPPISAALKTHPFLKTLQPDGEGYINWRVDGVNGTDLTKANSVVRAKALESMKKANKLSFILRRILK